MMRPQLYTCMYHVSNCVRYLFLTHIKDGFFHIHMHNLTVGNVLSQYDCNYMLLQATSAALSSSANGLHRATSPQLHVCSLMLCLALVYTIILHLMHFFLAV